MQKLMAAAAIAATLSFTLAPATANAPSTAAQVPEATVGNPVAEPVAPAANLFEAHNHAETPAAAAGQGRADFHAWLAGSPQGREDVRAFRTYLASHGVDDVVPIWQLVRTSSSWRECAAGRFEVAPRDKWDNIVTTLKFIEKDVVPAVGPVQAVSGYRNENLNRCSAGAPASAHRMFFALDLMPVDADVSRGELIQGVCRAHARDGRAHETGLGFYNGVRFHVDSNGFRRWGPDGRGASSPCASVA